MARITRKELKTDKFALEVEHTVTFFEEHQKLIMRYGAVALALIALIVGYSMYRGASIANARKSSSAPFRSRKRRWGRRRRDRSPARFRPRK